MLNEIKQYRKTTTVRFHLHTESKTAVSQKQKNGYYQGLCWCGEQENVGQNVQWNKFYHRLYSIVSTIDSR